VSARCVALADQGLPLRPPASAPRHPAQPAPSVAAGTPGCSAEPARRPAPPRPAPPSPPRAPPSPSSSAPPCHRAACRPGRVASSSPPAAVGAGLAPPRGRPHPRRRSPPHPPPRPRLRSPAPASRRRPPRRQSPPPPEPPQPELLHLSARPPPLHQERRRPAPPAEAHASTPALAPSREPGLAQRSPLRCGRARQHGRAPAGVRQPRRRVRLPPAGPPAPSEPPAPAGPPAPAVLRSRAAARTRGAARGALPGCPRSSRNVRAQSSWAPCAPPTTGRGLPLRQDLPSRTI